MATHANISKKRKHVAEGVFKAELDGFLRKELAEDGYSGVEGIVIKFIFFENKGFVKPFSVSNFLGNLLQPTSSKMLSTSTSGLQLLFSVLHLFS